MEGKLYLVQSMFDDEVSISLRSQYEIISRIDMKDCSNEEMYVFDVSQYGSVKPLVIHGCWHKLSNPLYIKVTDEEGNIEFDGYGTDH